MSDKIVFIGLVLFRGANALLANTYFQADEYWQSLEIAHKRVFGYGYETWDWTFALRSYAFPAIFEVLFRLLKLFGLHNSHWLVRNMYAANGKQTSPRLVQAVFAATTDFYTYKLARKHFGNTVAHWSVRFITVNLPFSCFQPSFCGSIGTFPPEHWSIALKLASPSLHCTFGLWIITWRAWTQH
jgi:phosphatidylinositol glycan class B